MHNGDVANFRLVRRKLLETVCDEAFSNVYGSTDSEHFFALFIDSLLKLDEPDPALRMAQALARAIGRVLALVQKRGGGRRQLLERRDLGRRARSRFAVHGRRRRRGGVAVLRHGPDLSRRRPRQRSAKARKPSS